MKTSLLVLAVVFSIALLALMLNPNRDLRVMLTKCEESVLGSGVTTRTCHYPSRLMKLDEAWICSCRSEAETRKGITGK